MAWPPLGRVKVLESISTVNGIDFEPSMTPILSLSLSINQTFPKLSDVIVYAKDLLLGILYSHILSSSGDILTTLSALN